MKQTGLHYKLQKTENVYFNPEAKGCKMEEIETQHN